MRVVLGDWQGLVEADVWESWKLKDPAVPCNIAAKPATTSTSSGPNRPHSAVRGLEDQRGFVATFDFGKVLFFHALGVSAKCEPVRRKNTQPLEDLLTMPA